MTSPEHGDVCRGREQQKRQPHPEQFGLTGCLVLLDFASHLHLLFFLVLNKSSVKEEYLQIFSICTKNKCWFLLSVDNKYWLGCIMLSAALIYVLHFNHMLFKHL